MFQLGLECRGQFFILKWNTQISFPSGIWGTIFLPFILKLKYKITYKIPRSIRFHLSAYHFDDQIHLCNNQPYSTQCVECRKSSHAPPLPSSCLPRRQPLFRFLFPQICFSLYKCTLLCLAFLFQHNVLEIHLCCFMYQQFIHYLNISKYFFIHSPFYGHLDQFQFSAIMNKTSMKIIIQCFSGRIFLFNFIRNSELSFKVVTAFYTPRGD